MTTAVDTVRFARPVDDLRPEALLDDYTARLRRRNYAKTTISYYSRALRVFLAAFDGTPLADIKALDVERFLDTQQLSPRSWCTSFGVIKSFFTYLVEQREVLQKNPCLKIERPRWQPKLRPSLTWKDFNAICRVCQGLEERALVEVLYLTGLRSMELRQLTWTDVDLEKRQITVQSGKGGKSRVVVLPQRSAELLAVMKRTKLRPRSVKWTWDDNRPVFPGGQFVHRPRREFILNDMLKRLAKEAGLPYKVTCHTMRHGFFLLLKTRGVPLEVAARLGGHSSIRTTADVYGALDLDHLQKVYNEKIGGIVGPAAEAEKIELDVDISEAVTNARPRARSIAPA